MLVLRKIGLAFVVGFAAVFLPGLIGIIDGLEGAVAGEVDWTLQLNLLASLVLGAAAAGIRALLMYLTAFVPSDAQQGVNLLGAYKRAQPPDA